MDLIARISELLEERGWTKYQLAKEANLSQTTIQSMMKRGNNPTVATIEHCCRAFGITVSEFFNDDSRTTEFSLEERKLISDYRNLSHEMKKAVAGVISAAKTNSEEEAIIS